MAFRIAHVVLSLPVGGTERLVEHMIRKPPADAEAACICLDKLGSIGETLRDEGFSIQALNRKAGVDWGLGFRLARLARQGGYDILHCHQYSPWFYGMIAKTFHPGLKILLTEHGRFHPDIPSPKRRIFNRIATPFANRLVAVSPATRDALIQIEAFAPGRVEVVFNGVSARDPGIDPREARRRLNLDPDGLYFILCARFDPIKWIPGLVEAFASAAAAHTKAKLLLIGDGPEKNLIEQTIARLGLTDRVVLPGFQSDVSIWLRAADIFVLSSHSEGTSVSLIEAMSMGLPAIVTHVGGNPFVVEKDITALTVPPGNSQALGEAMTLLALDPALRQKLGEAARLRYQKLFRLETMLDGYATIYRNLLGKNPSRA